MDVSDPAGARRVETGSPQHLVDDEVADAGDAGLVHQPSLQRRRLLSSTVSRSRFDRSMRRGRGAILVGVELDPPQAPRIAHAEVTAVVEAQREAVPRFQSSIARVDEIVHADDPVEQQPPAHAEAKARSPGRRGRIEQQRACRSSTDTEDAASRQRDADRVGREPTLEVPRVGRQHLGDPAPETPPPPAGGSASTSGSSGIAAMYRRTLRSSHGRRRCRCHRAGPGGEEGAVDGAVGRALRRGRHAAASARGARAAWSRAPTTSSATTTDEGVYKPFHLEDELGPADCGHGRSRLHVVHAGVPSVPYVGAGARHLPLRP